MHCVELRGSRLPSATCLPAHTPQQKVELTTQGALVATPAEPRRCLRLIPFGGCLLVLFPAKKNLKNVESILQVLSGKCLFLFFFFCT